MRRIVLPCLLIGTFWSLTAAPVRAVDLDEAQIAQRCPGMVDWTKAHPHSDSQATTEDAQRSFTQPALRAELLRMAEEDGRLRNAVLADKGRHPEVGAAATEADGRHLQRLKQIDAAQGFPTKPQVGVAGVHAAWLLTQHADRDTAFQAHVLDELNSRDGGGGIRPQDLAFLTDRVLSAQGKSQRYGTQFVMAAGVFQPKPIEDAANVDKRRAAIGLMPMADYACVMHAVYGVPTKH